MNKILLASVAAIIATMSFASASYAGSRHHNNDDLFNVEINFGFKPKRIRHVQREVYFAPQDVEYGIGYEDDRDEPVCTIKTKQKINRWGQLVTKQIETCRR